MKKPLTYKELIEKNPNLKYISKKSWDYIKDSDKGTLDLLKEKWLENITKNIESKRFKRHGGLTRDCIEFGRNKAIIGIGAGPSLKNNLDVLKRIHDIDGIKHPDDRNFIFIASNHMYKPLLKEGIYPDFVAVADASDVVLDQLTKDIPEEGRHTILVAGLQCSPKVLKKWEKQGKDIRFYLTSSEDIPEKYEELTGEKRDPLIVQQGGNVLNTCWSIGLKFFKSSVFMALGNDLSYPLLDDVEDRRKGYYADGDYSSNAIKTGTGRDEAKRKNAWMGFKLSRSKVISLKTEEMYNIELEPVGTTGNLWVYKNWLEANLISNSGSIKHRYYNCSEGGIVGVMCKDDTPEGRENIENWFMLDSVCPEFKTRMFEDAISEFLQAKDYLKWGPAIKDAKTPNAIISGHLN